MPARSDKENPAMENTRRAKVTTPSEREIVSSGLRCTTDTRVRGLDEGRTCCVLVGPKLPGPPLASTRMTPQNTI